MPKLAILRVPAIHTTPDIQTDLESKPFDQLLTFWCLFYHKTTRPPPVERVQFIIKNLGSRLFFYLQNCQVMSIAKNDNLDFFDKIAISQEGSK
jgi:hypothetical protein